MNFKQAIEEMKKGKKVRRKGEYGWLAINNDNDLLRYFPNPINVGEMGTGVETLSLKTIESIFANDWEIVEEKKKWWEPKMYHEYYLIRWNGDINFTTNSGSSDSSAMAIGNCFQTKEQAEFIVEKLRVIHELEKFAFENNEEEIDWNNSEQRKYYLYFDYADMSIVSCDSYSKCQHIPLAVYFTSKEIADKSIKAIGEERLKKYYFGVKDE